MNSAAAAAAFLAAAALFSGCAAFVPARPRQPSSLAHGLLVARVSSRGALFRRFVSVADRARVEALDEKGEPIPGLSAVSGVSGGGYVFFVDMPAGRYVLREATFPSRGVRYELVAPADAALKRSVVLRPGTAAFLGEHVYDARWPEFGVAVGRIARIVGHWLTPWMKRPVLPRDADLRLYEPGPASEIGGLRAAREAFAGTQWKRVIEARLRELSAPEPAKTEGAIRERELPLREEKILSWRDTLKWGEPRRAEEGLAWVRPGGEARVVVYHTTATAPGFAGWAAAVAELRREASRSVEDSGGLYNVRVATRTALAAKVTTYVYPEGTLVGSETKVLRTETALVPDGAGLYTARLRAPVEEFDSVLPAYREFLLQLVLGPPAAKAGPKPDPVMPGFITP